MASFSKEALIEEVAERNEITKAAAGRVLASIQDVVIEQVVAGNDVSLYGFASFKPRVSAARTVKSPQTGEPIDVPEKKVVKIRPLGKFAKAVAEG